MLNLSPLTVLRQLRARVRIGGVEEPGRRARTPLDDDLESVFRYLVDPAARMGAR